MISRRRLWVFRFGSAALSIASLLIVLEAGLRITGTAVPLAKLYAMPDEELSWVNKPNSDVEVAGLDYRYRVRINSLGLRGDELDPDADFRILAIGDSKTFCQRGRRS